jgi:hypothetical protein
MTANPIELIGGITTDTNVPKADIVSWAKARVPQVLANNAEIRSTNLALQQVVFVKTPGISWYLDSSDNTTEDDDVNCVVSLDNKRFKPLSSIPAPTTLSLGGVFSLAPVTNHFLTGIDTDGTPLHARPAATDLSDGVTGTGAVVRSTSPVITTPTGIVKGDVGLGNVDNTSNATERAATRTLTNASIAGDANTITNLTTAMFATNVVDTDGTLAANSDTRIASQKATKTYLDQIIAAADAMVFKGVVDCSANPNYPAADRGWTYKVSVAGKIGGASGTTVDVGDTLLCITDSTASGNQATVGASWNIVQANLVGAVIGPASSTSGNFASFNGTGGTVIQDSGKATPTGVVVGTTDSQTLTNKTLTAPVVNTPDINGGTVDSITSFGIRSSGADFDLQMLSSEVLTGNRALSWVLGDAARTITLGGNPTLNGGTHSGTNTGDQTITLTGDITGSGTGSFATTIGANKVTLGMMAQVATATFLGRTTAGTGNVEALTAAQATALLNAMVGDSGSGGTKGLVPAPGAGDAAGGKFLKADGTYAVPPGSGGGSLPDDVRQNLLLTTAYQSKSFAEYRRLVLMFATGFKGATDALNGINTGSSSNYTVDTVAGNVAPSVAAGTPTIIAYNAAGSTNVGNMTGGAGIAAAFDNTTSQAAASSARLTTAGVIQWVGKDYGSGNTHRVGRFRVFGPNNATLSGGAGAVFVRLYGSNVATGPTSPQDGTLISTGTNANTTAETYDVTVDSVTSYRWIWVTISTTSNAAPADAIIAEAQFYDYVADTANNMTLVTTSQTADSTVSNGRVLIEFDNTATPALNTDLTVEVTCNGGTNWASATLSSVSVNGQGGRKIVETADTACTSGTSFAARIKTLNNKLVPIYGVSLTVH